jgi:hypothetical protein
MPFTPNRNLSQVSNQVLHDYQHAARLFTDGQFALAPKWKFSYHLAFGLNKAALRDPSLGQVHNNEINMLVKSADLPNFEIKIETLNQYNRKKNIQYKQEYKPLNIVFHDDNIGVINNLWNNYYSYYYADPTSATKPGAYNRTATRSFAYTTGTYGLDNGSTTPFFTYIKMYQMARHEYVCYKLHNPIITAWNHNKVSYSTNDVHDNNMTIAYEAVSYSYGNVTAGTPEGFGLEHYDQTPSTLSGINQDGRQPASFVSTSKIKDNSTSFLGNLIDTVNTYQNTKTVIDNVNNIVTSTSNTLVSNVSGISNVAFPTASISGATVIAKPI